MLGDLARTEAGFLGAYALSYLAALVLHEGGHALAAGWLGFHPRMVRIGSGKLVLRVRFGQTWLVVRRFPVSGGMTSLPRPPERVAASAAVVLGGIAANAATLAAITGVWAAGWVGDDWIMPVAVPHALGALLNAVPSKLTSKQPASDGLTLWRLLRGPPSDFIAKNQAIRLKEFLLPFVPVPPVSEGTLELLYQMGRPELRDEAWARQDACAVLGRLAAGGTLPPPEQAAVLDFLCDTSLMAGGTGASLDELDAWSAAGLDLVNVPATRVTRGGVLAALGRPNEAVTALLDTLDQATAAGRGIRCLAYLAQATAAGGLPDSARDWLRLARTMAQRQKRPVVLAQLDRIEAGLPAVGAADQVRERRAS